MVGPTLRQLEILGFIASSIRDRGYAPTQREMMANFGWVSTNAARDHLSLIERKGLVTTTHHMGYRALSRALVVTDAGWRALGYSGAPPKPARRESTARVVNVNLGWRCVACGAQTFDLTKPCAICAMKKRERAA